MKILLALSIAFISACTLGPSKERDPASVLPVGDYATRELTDAGILKLSSSGNLKIGELKILTNNTDALESKIDIINKATSSIDLMYYIYGTDGSSSYMSNALLAAAQRGVNIRMLVDFFVNYKNYDTFKMLETKSNGKIQVAFYGVPSGPLLKSMGYMVSPCEQQNKSCVQKKWDAINAIHAQKKVPFFTKLLVTGMYGKSPDLVKISLSEGAQLDVKAGPEVTPDEKRQLFEFLELVFRAKMKGDIGAKVKLGLALAFYGKETLPIYERLMAVLPMAGGGENLAQYWENATDFIHHKLIIADSKYFQLGGRNVEDSYHMPASPSGKYTFLDTDVYVEAQEGGDAITKSYENMWGFSESVKTIKELDSVYTHSFLARENLMPLVDAIKKCYHLKKTPEYSGCIEKTAEAQLAITMPQRIERAAAHLNTKSSEFLSKKPVQGNTQIAMSDSNTFITYLENLSFTKKSGKRLFGAGGDKNISELWIQSIKNTCRQGGKKTPQQITILNAYVFMPGAVYTTIGDALSGRIDCPNTTITIATNSAQSTDLGVVNLFAAYQMLWLTKIKPNSRGATLKVLEMKKVPSQTTYSLHTKASIFGNDLIIGSANADIRSYHMDSNNALFVRNAPELVANYKKWVADFIGPKGNFSDMTATYSGLTAAQAKALSANEFDKYVANYKADADTKTRMKKFFMDICNDINDESKYFLEGTRDDRQKMRLKQRVKDFDSKYQTI